MEAFLTVIFFIIVGFYLLGLISKLLLRYWIAKKQREFQEQFGEQGGASSRAYTWNFGGRQQQQRPETKREGEVRVENPNTNSSKRISKDVGEYVDYEEVKK